jgi:EmrB/QacA subfamily drug resistance transporter
MRMDAIRADNAAMKRTVLLVTTLGAFISPFGISSVNIALPSIGREFGMGAVLLGWVTTSYLLACATFGVPFGRVADLYGRKRTFTYGITTFTLASIALALSSSGVMLICFRILQGIGAAANYTVGAAILTSVFPPRDLGRVLGINLGAVYVGYSLGPTLGGFLTHHLGWRSIFLVNVLFGLAVIFLIFCKLKGEWGDAKKERFDFTGAIIFSLTLLMIVYGFSRLSTILGLFLILLGGVGILTFIKWEARVEVPVMDISLFRNNRAFVFSNLAALISYSATYAVTFLLSLYLQYIRKLTPENAGLVLVFQPIVQALFSPFSGKLSDRIEPGILASIGMALTALGLFLLAFLDDGTPLGFIVGSLILFGFGFSLFSSPNSNAVMRSVENRFYGVASGILGTMRMAGMAFSMGITILIFSIYIGKVQITPEYYPLFLGCIKLAFIFFGVLCVVGVLASLARGKIRRE